DGPRCAETGRVDPGDAGARGSDDRFVVGGFALVRRPDAGAPCDLGGNGLAEALDLGAHADEIGVLPGLGGLEAFQPVRVRVGPRDQPGLSRPRARRALDDEARFVQCVQGIRCVQDTAHGRVAAEAEETWLPRVEDLALEARRWASQLLT